jgi:hypothetical protein
MQDSGLSVAVLFGEKPTHYGWLLLLRIPLVHLNLYVLLSILTLVYCSLSLKPVYLTLHTEYLYLFKARLSIGAMWPANLAKSVSYLKFEPGLTAQSSSKEEMQNLKVFLQSTSLIAVVWCS